MTSNWNSAETIIWIQRGGAGNNWQYFGTVNENSGGMSSIAGGGQPVEGRYARDTDAGYGAFKAVGLVNTGNPDPWTFTLMKRLRNPITETGINALRLIFGCLHGVRIQSGCGDLKQPTNYTGFYHFPDTRATAYPTSENMSNGTEAASVDNMQQIEESALTLITGNKLIHLDITGTNSDVDINKVIRVGVIQCAGDCGSANDGNQDFWAVTDRDSTPGHGGAASPRFMYTTDGGTTWSGIYIDDFTTADATDVVKLGQYVVVASPTANNGGVAYALYQDIVDGVSNPFAVSTGIVATSGAPRALALAGLTLFAVGNGGYIYRATDGIGAAFSVLSAGTVTSQNFLCAAAADENLAWFGANSGVLVRYDRGSIATVTISGITGNIKTVAVPPGRGNELYVGTSSGRIFRTRNATATTPTFSELSFAGSGTGSVDEIRFDRSGAYMYVVQSNASGLSRILRDMSGGAMGVDVEFVGSYTSPTNVGINSIAPADSNTAITVGQLLASGYGFIGKVQ